MTGETTRQAIARAIDQFLRKQVVPWTPAEMADAILNILKEHGEEAEAAVGAAIDRAWNRTRTSSGRLLARAAISAFLSGGRG